MIHPNQWPDLIIGFLIAEGLIYGLRSILHRISNRNHSRQAAERLEAMRPAALDSYRFSQNRESQTPLG